MMEKNINSENQFHSNQNESNEKDKLTQAIHLLEQSELQKRQLNDKLHETLLKLKKYEKKMKIMEKSFMSQHSKQFQNLQSALIQSNEKITTLNEDHSKEMNLIKNELSRKEENLKNVETQLNSLISTICESPITDFQMAKIPIQSLQSLITNSSPFDKKKIDLYFNGLRTIFSIQIEQRLINEDEMKSSIQENEQQFEKLKAQVTELENKIEITSNTEKKLNLQISKEHQEISKFINQYLPTSTSNIEDEQFFSKEFSKIEKEFLNQREKFEETNNVLNQKEKEISQLNQQILLDEKKIDSLQDNLERIKIDSQSQADSTKIINELQNKYEENINQLNKQISNLQEKNSGYKYMVQDSKVLLTKFNNLQKSYEEKSNQIITLKTNETNLNNQISQLKIKIDELKEDNENQFKENQRIKDLCQKKEKDYLTAIKDLSKDTQFTKQSNSDLTQNLKEATQHIEEMNETINNKQLENNQLYKQIRTLKAKLENLENDKAELIQKIQKQTEKIKKFKQQNIRNLGSLNEISHKTKHFEKLVVESQTKDSKIQQLTQLIQEKDNEILTSKESIQEQLTLLQQLEDKLNESKEEYRILKTDNEEFHKMHFEVAKQLEESNDQIKQDQKEIFHQKTIIEKLQIEKTFYQDQLNIKADQISRLQIQMDNVEKKNNILQSNLDKYERDKRMLIPKDDLEKALRDLQIKEKDNNQLRVTIQTQESQLLSLKSQQNSLMEIKDKYFESQENLKQQKNFIQKLEILVKGLHFQLSNSISYSGQFISTLAKNLKPLFDAYNLSMLDLDSIKQKPLTLISNRIFSEKPNNFEKVTDKERDLIVQLYNLLSCLPIDKTDLFAHALDDCFLNKLENAVELAKRTKDAFIEQEENLSRLSSLVSSQHQTIVRMTHVKSTRQ